MAHTLRLQLLGAPQIRLGDEPVEGFVTQKALALLIYIATNQRSQRRDKLASLFWRDVAEQQAQNSLRRVLSNLRQLVGTHLMVDRQVIALDERQSFWSDVTEFRAALATLPINAQVNADLINSTQLENALALYQGEFLDGFYVDDAPAFEEWVFLQREELRDLALRGFTLLTEYYLATNNFAAGLAITQRLLALEPWYEIAHYQRMLLLLRGGQRTEALMQYEACCKMLVEEFSIEPSAAMQALYEQIKDPNKEGRNAEAVASSSPQAASLTSQAASEPTLAADPAFDATQQTASEVSAHKKVASLSATPQIYWGEMPRPSFFTGRQTELNQLQRWLLEERCSLITLLGSGGAGKTTLAASLVRALAAVPSRPGQSVNLRPLGENAEAVHSVGSTEDVYAIPHMLAPPFTRILWRSLLNAPPLDNILRLWLHELSDHQLTHIPTDLDEQLSLLFGYLTQQRCLLVLDNLESLLSAGEAAGHYLPGYEAYGVLIQRIGEVEHQSCLLLTSRELPLGVARLERSYPTVRSLRLDGLPTTAGVDLLRASGLRAEQDAMQMLVQRYSGNPLALRLVAETVADYYGGDVADFLRHETLIFEDIRLVLDQQFARLSDLERALMFWLTVERAPTTAQQLAANFVQPPVHRVLLEALRSLHRRSLVERDTLDPQMNTEGEAVFSLQNVVLEYSTEHFRELICAELTSEKFDYCLRHALVKAQATDHVRNTQIRLILQPIAQYLLETYGQRGVAAKLQHLVDKLRSTYAVQSGYAAANLLHLAFHLGVKPEGWDFSQLSIRQADLRKVHLPYTNFTQAHFAQSVFMEKFDAILAVAVSQDGELCAAGGASGNIHLWRASDSELLSICRGQGRWVWALAFSPNRSILASGGSDQVVNLWEVAEIGQQEIAAHEVSPLHYALTGHTDTIFGLAFRPDGECLATASADCTIRLWDVTRKALIQTLTGHTATVYAVAFSPTGQWLASASRDHTVRVWHAATGVCLQLLEGHQAPLVACHFSLDGQWLVTASVDRMILVWQVCPGEAPNRVRFQLHHTLAIDGDELAALTLSPDGKVIATNGPDATIRLWSRMSGTLVQTLYGHTENVQALAFHPNGKALVSGGWDQAVRFWNVGAGHLLHTLQGYTNAIHALALSADGQRLVSGNADGTLCLWQRSTHDLGRPQTGHQGTAQTVAFHPAGDLLASGGSDHAIRLWQVSDGQLTEQKTFYGHRGAVQCICFSPTGHLLASSSVDQTVHLWDTQTGDCRQVLRGANRTIEALAFSPDGSCLVGGCDDGRIFRWLLPNKNDLVQASGVVLYNLQPFATIPGGCTSLAFSPDGALLAGSGPDHLIFLWQAYDGEKLLTIETPVNSTVYALAFRPNQDVHTPQLASSSGTGAICFWTIDLPHRTQHCHYVRSEHKGSVRSILFTADGQMLFSGGADETIKLWEVETGQCVATLPLEQPYAGMKLTDATGLTAAQRAACKALGALA